MHYLLHASWVLPIDSPPVKNGVISIRAGRIDSIESYSSQRHCLSDSNFYSFAGEALLPGLVNAHTHLEFSDLKKPLGYRGIEFTKWIELVVSERSQSANEPGNIQSIENGIEELRQTGTVAVGEIASSNWLPNYKPNLTKISGVCFFERLGNDPARQTELAGQLDSFMDQPIVHQSWRPGISPHSPYSVSLNLLEELLMIAQTNRVPVAMHLAETEAELELLSSATGSFVDLLKKLGAWFPSRFSTPTSILDYLKLLQKAERCLVVHGNYLSSIELDFIAAHGNFSLVYCPRTHDFFGHADYPLEGILERGINLSVGTDSRASNPDLSLWNELRMIARKFPGLDRHTILELGTINGAKALGFENEFGALRSGQHARVLRAKLGDSSTSNPCSDLLDNALDPVETYPVVVDPERLPGIGSE